MKKKLFTALLSLVTIAGFAIVDRPQVSLSAQGPVGVLPYEEFTFTISYRNVKEMAVVINEVTTDNIYLWPWQMGDIEWRTMDYTDKIMGYDMSVTYTVVVYNEEGQDDKSIVFTTPGPPFTGR